MTVTQVNANDLRETISWRHFLHGAPEIGFKEFQTSQFVGEKLRSFGLDVHAGIGGTGVIGVLRRGAGNRSIALRAELDALKITERGEHSHVSKHPGFMHACGHDGHMAMLLGAARSLSQAGTFSGTVVFVFQPAEEHGRGAQAMIDDGLLDRFPFDEIYALHNMPGMPAGHFGTRSGPFKASEDNFEIRIRGKGGHAARPHMGSDPIVAGAHLVIALQSIVSRRIDPVESAVVSVTEFITDGLRNVIPENVTIRGDARSYRPRVQELLEREVRSISQGVGGAFGATVEVDYTHEFAPTINHEEETRHAAAAAVAVAGADRTAVDTPANMGADDFGLFLRHRPGNLSYIGNGTQAASGLPLHNAGYDFNDDILAAGIAYWSELVHRRLPG